VLEIFQISKRPIDRGEPKIGNLIEGAQRPEDRKPNVMASHLSRASGSNCLLDVARQQSEIVIADRPTLAGLAHTDDHLAPAERLGDPRALHDRERDCLSCGEAFATLGALPASTDRSAILGRTRVDNA